MKHWTEEDFLNRLYEVGPDDTHLDQCPSCRTRWQELQAARQRTLVTPEVPAVLLTAQRARIYHRVERGSPVSFWFRWSPAVAVAGMALFAILWRAPLPQKIPVPTAPVTQSAAHSSDAQLMAELYKTAYDTVPDSVEPLQGLFEVKQ